MHFFTRLFTLLSLTFLLSPSPPPPPWPQHYYHQQPPNAKPTHHTTRSGRHVPPALCATFLYSNSHNKGRVGIRKAAVPAFWLGTRCHRLAVHAPERYGLSVKRTQMHKYCKHVYRSCRYTLHVYFIYLLYMYRNNVRSYTHKKGSQVKIIYTKPLKQRAGRCIGDGKRYKIQGENLRPPTPPGHSITGAGEQRGDSQTGTRRIVYYFRVSTFNALCINTCI